MKSKKSAILFILSLILILGLFTIINYYIHNNVKTTKEEKRFTLCVASERDFIETSYICKSDYKYLGDYLKAQDYVTYTKSFFGTHITAIDNISEHSNDQFRWCVFVNGVYTTDNVDKIPLVDGATYNLELKYKQ